MITHTVFPHHNLCDEAPSEDKLVWTKYRCYFHCLLNFTLDQPPDISPLQPSTMIQKHLDLPLGHHHHHDTERPRPFTIIVSLTLLVSLITPHTRSRWVLSIFQRPDHLANTLADVRWWPALRPWFSGRETAVLRFCRSRSLFRRWAPPSQPDGTRKSRPPR